MISYFVGIFVVVSLLCIHDVCSQFKCNCRYMCVHVHAENRD